MPVRCERNGKGEEVCRYVPLPDMDIFEEFMRISKMFEQYLSRNGIPFDDVYINRALFREIIIRVDIHKEYFRTFHKDTRINEIKRAALLAYWVLRSRPFVLPVKDPTDPRADFRINEGFAALIILSAVTGHCAEKGYASFTISHKYAERLMYALRHWDISKEAMMLVAETLAESACGVRVS